MSPVVINLRSSLSTATAADLKIPPPEASGLSPPPSVVFGSLMPCIRAAQYLRRYAHIASSSAHLGGRTSPQTSATNLSFYLAFQHCTLVLAGPGLLKLYQGTQKSSSSHLLLHTLTDAATGFRTGKARPRCTAGDPRCDQPALHKTADSCGNLTETHQGCSCGAIEKAS